MVVGAADPYPAAIGNTIGIGWGIGNCTIYLHFVLIMVNKKSTATILVLIVACLILYWMVGKKYLLITALVLGLIGIFIPYLAEKIHWGWMKLGSGMGYITGRIILILIFFLVLYPLSAASKLFRKNVVKMKPGIDSYFKDRNYVYTRKSMETPW